MAVALAVVLALPAAARADQAPGEESAPMDEPGGGRGAEAPRAGLSMELELATGYIFRGDNVFQSGSQLNPTLLIQPAVDWSIGETGLTVGYWSVYQLTGDNIDANIEAGSGAEQGLYVHYRHQLTDAFSLILWLNGYFYPAATEESAGTDFPCYLEPGAGILMDTFLVGIGLDVSVLVGLQDAISGRSYLYLNPYIDRLFELREDQLWLELRAGFGYKVLTEDATVVVDNIFDLQLSAKIT